MTEFDSTITYGDDRIVAYRAFPTERGTFGPATLRVRTYGGRLLARDDVRYRQMVVTQLEANGCDVLEVIVTDEPFYEGFHTDPVAGFFDARTPVAA